MKKYSKERKESMLKKMMAPCNMPISQLSEESGISQMTLYNWRNQSREKGEVVPGNGKNPERWSSEEKFRIVLATSALNEAELSEYCRKKGLYAEQIAAWKQACMVANSVKSSSAKVSEGHNQYQKKIKKLEKELLRKERALAETAALLVLRKKVTAIWGEREDV